MDDGNVELWERITRFEELIGKNDDDKYLVDLITHIHGVNATLTLM